jgi:predicted HD phosphohydrolase
MPRPEIVAPAREARSPLLRPDWRHVEKTALEEMDAADWALIESQRVPFCEGRQAREALALLAASRNDPTFGYQINNYRHCLQSATMMWRDGADEETVVVALLHDIGFTLAGPSHGEFSAALLRPFISDANHWMLKHHQYFQSYHCHDHPGCNTAERERFRGHPVFEQTARFIERFDQNAVDPNYDNAPLDVFEPMVQRLFAKTAKPLP